MHAQQRTQIHGHRGCSGHGPENTVPAFLHAVGSGCHWLELDVVITADDHVLVSHEPWMDHQKCLDPLGRSFTEDQGRDINIFMLPLVEVQRYPCVTGTEVIDKPAFPDHIHKPTLSETVQAVDRSADQHDMAKPGFNIEVKSDPALYGSFQPGPIRFAELVVQAVVALGIAERCIIQSFDVAILEAVRAWAPLIPVALLVENEEGLDANLLRLSFKPDLYSPAFAMANEATAKALRAKSIGLLVWTVNDVVDMERMLRLGVEGIITDHPERAMALVSSRY